MSAEIQPQRSAGIRKGNSKMKKSEKIKPETEIKTVAIVGLGALGLLYGEHIQKMIGRENLFFPMDHTRYLHHKNDCYTVNGLPLDFQLVDAAESTPADLIIVAVKYNSLTSALDIMKPLLAPHTILLSVMNGIVSEEIIAKRYPNATVLPCVAIGMDAMRDGTNLHYVNKGKLQIGAASEKQQKALATVDTFFQKISMPYHIEADIMHAMWKKFMINVGINQACMVYDSSYAEVMQSPEKRASFERAMREVMVLSEAEGIWLTEEDFNAAVELMNSMDPTSYPSMHQDYKAGRKSEVELFSGTVRRIADKHGISVPENDFYYRRIHEIESSYEQTSSPETASALSAFPE